MSVFSTASLHNNTIRYASSESHCSIISSQIQSTLLSIHSSSASSAVATSTFVESCLWQTAHTVTYFKPLWRQEHNADLQSVLHLHRIIFNRSSGAGGYRLQVIIFQLSLPTPLQWVENVIIHSLPKNGLEVTVQDVEHDSTLCGWQLLRLWSSCSGSSQLAENLLISLVCYFYCWNIDYSCLL